MPVAWLGDIPARRPDDPARRRPVVAVIDTGVGKHPWFGQGVHLQPVALGVPLDNPELTGITDDEYGGLLDDDAGHGTFITGIIRQRSPDADILAIQVMGGDGAAPESDVLDVLGMLAVRQDNAVRNGNAADLIDVVCLSLGYYHEQPADAAFDQFLLEPIVRLARNGVAVVVAAGNDSTDRPMYPAAFTPWPGGPVTQPDPLAVPVISVAALNPDGRSTALFSNTGPWVATSRRGAALVSTFPVTFNGALQPTQMLDVGQVRATIDPDNFSSGFGTWSGTSFAAPVFAADIARQLSARDLSATDQKSMVTRAQSAVTECLKERP
jgi:subtilisin family serine protease